MFIRRALDEPTSRIRAAINGEDWLGYDRMQSRLDDVADLIQLLIQVSGGAKRPKVKNPVERPAVKKAEPQKFTRENAMALVAMASAS